MGHVRQAQAHARDGQAAVDAAIKAWVSSYPEEASLMGLVNKGWHNSGTDQMLGL